jgi:C4-dicarboxylate transporter DctM subunit
MDSFPLLAIPFFMFAGQLMGAGGISKRIVNFADHLVGFVVGGLGMVTVLACMFFAAISGSAAATVSAIGSFMIPAMKKNNYSGAFAAAVTAASGTIGVMIPPSIPFVVYCVLTSQSIGDLFIAGIMPGILIGFSLMIVVYFMAKKRGYKNAENAGIPTFRSFCHAFLDAFWALLVPVIILGGIYLGVFTPTEASVVGCVYAFFAGKFIYKELTWAGVVEALREASTLNGATQFLVGLSLAFGYFLTVAGIPQRLCEAILEVSSNTVIIMLAINAFLLLVGCFVDNIAAMMILVPIILPVLKAIDYDILLFGVVMTVNLAIGFCTPPFGINLFVAGAISKESIESISKELIWFIFVMLIDLMIITYVPSVSLFLLGR